ncbi:MAG: hypothetical protein ACRCYQ_11230 [Nocardioides sp.]
MLEIGEDTGALIVSAPAGLVGREIEIHPFGAGHRHRHAQRGGHAPHVAVIPRELPNGSLVHCAVFPDLSPGAYTLRLIPDGSARDDGSTLYAVVRAGQVSTTDWAPA